MVPAVKPSHLGTAPRGEAAEVTTQPGVKHLPAARPLQHALVVAQVLPCSYPGVEKNKQTQVGLT